MYGKYGSYNLPPEFRLKNVNGSFFAVFDRPLNTENDSTGALVFVMAIVFIWGLSIVLLIASHIRKNTKDDDSNVSLYLKEIQSMRKRSRQEKTLQVKKSLEEHETRSNYVIPNFQDTPSASLLTHSNSAYQLSPVKNSSLKRHHSLFASKKSNLYDSVVLHQNNFPIKERFTYGCLLPEIRVYSEDSMISSSPTTTPDEVKTLNPIRNYTCSSSTSEQTTMVNIENNHYSDLSSVTIDLTDLNEDIGNESDSKYMVLSSMDTDTASNDHQSGTAQLTTTTC